MPKDAPSAPPIVATGNGAVAHLLAWKLAEADGSWYAWLSWVQQSGERAVHRVVSVRASGLEPLEESEAYARVPRRVRGSDGSIRPWSGETGDLSSECRA